MTTTIIRDNMMESLKGFVIPDIIVTLTGLFHFFIAALPTIYLILGIIYLVCQIIYIRNKIKKEK